MDKKTSSRHCSNLGGPCMAFVHVVLHTTEVGFYSGCQALMDDCSGSAGYLGGRVEEGGVSLVM